MSTQIAAGMTPIYAVILGGEEHGCQIYLTKDKARFDDIDPDIPELDREKLSDGFHTALSLADAFTLCRMSGWQVIEEKWGFC